MITRKQLAKKWELTQRTIDRYREKGMPYHQAFEGAAVKFNEEEVEEWIKKNDREDD